MKPVITKNFLRTGTMLALWLVLAAAAQACLWGEGPEDRVRRSDFAESAFRIFPEAHTRGFGLRTAHHAPSVEGDGPGFFQRPIPFHFAADRVLTPLEACAPGWGFFGLLGAGWFGALKALDLDQWLGQTRDEPILILFGGLARPLWAALIFRFDAAGGTCAPGPAPAPVPLPATFMMLGAGLAGLGALRVRQRRRR